MYAKTLYYNNLVILSGHTNINPCRMTSLARELDDLLHRLLLIPEGNDLSQLDDDQLRSIHRSIISLLTPYFRKKPAEAFSLIFCVLNLEAGIVDHTLEKKISYFQGKLGSRIRSNDLIADIEKL